MEKRDILIYLSIIFEGDWDRIYSAICRHISVDANEVERAVNGLKCGAITFFDADYPPELKQVHKPPFVLFYYGDRSLFYNYFYSIAVVGSREATLNILDKEREIVHNLRKNVVVVSGLAAGIDGMAHRAALESGHRTIAVLGSGLDYCYPSENRDLYERIIADQLLVSEYPLGVAPKPEYFPRRNRIIAGLSKVVFVPAAALRSGSMITVAAALEAGREIVCLPSVEYGNSGCNFCIKNGAYLVENAEDLNEFFPDKNYYAN